MAHLKSDGFFSYGSGDIKPVSGFTVLSYKWLQESELAVPGPLSLIEGLLYSHIKLGLKHFNIHIKTFVSG